MATDIAAVYRLADQEKKEGEKRPWSDLVPELLGFTQSHLFAGDYAIFHIVCKSWQSITRIPQPLLVSIHDSPVFQSPWLMFFNKKNHLFNFFNPIQNASYQVDIPELVDAEIQFSKDGWLLMCQGDTTIFFFNPFTMERIGLPDMPFYSTFTTMCFSTLPTSRDCQVVGISGGFQSAQVGTLKCGDESWTVREVQNYQNLVLFKCSPVMINGLFYLLDVAGNLGIFDPKDSEFSWTVCVKPLRKLTKSQKNFLIEIDGDLFAVFVRCDGRQVYVCKLNFSEAAWHEVQSLGDKMVHVCYRTSFSEKAVVRGTGNKIYFPRFYERNGVFYSLDTRKFHSFIGNFSKEDFYGTKDLKHCTWIKSRLTRACDSDISW